MAKRACTLQDIADQIGCARNTVSLALRGTTRISLKMRRRIERVAVRMGYVPNLAARNLKTRKSGLIGIYADGAQDDVRVTLINSLVTQLHSTRYKPILGLADAPDDPLQTSPWLQSFRALSVEALVVVAHEICEADMSVLEHAPTIVVGCEPGGVGEAADCIALDRHAAGRIGAEHLQATGQTEICVIPRAGAFGKGCLAALRQAGLKPCGPAVRADLPPEAMAGLCDKVLAARPRPTAVILGDSPLAVHFLRAALQRGVSIPEDLAVIGYDYFAWAEDLKVPLTTIEQPVPEMAALAVDLAKRRLAEPDAPIVQHVLPHRLVIRESA